MNILMHVCVCVLCMHMMTPTCGYEMHVYVCISVEFPVMHMTILMHYFYQQIDHIMRVLVICTHVCVSVNINEWLKRSFHF